MSAPVGAEEPAPAPCKSCPYRRDVPRGRWHRSEFKNLIAHDTSEYGGAVFQCHQDIKKPSADRGLCIGWLLDQRRRWLPSIQLRLKLMSDAGARDALERAHDGGAELYGSIEEMCRANGVRTARSKRR